MIYLNIAGLIIWIILTITYFLNPLEHSIPNWIVGLLGLSFIFNYLREINRGK